MRVQLTTYIGSMVLLGIFLTTSADAAVGKNRAVKPKPPIAVAPAVAPIVNIPVASVPVPVKQPAPIPPVVLPKPEETVIIAPQGTVQRGLGDLYRAEQKNKVHYGYLPHFVSIQLGGLPTEQKALQIRADYDYNYCFGNVTDDNGTSKTVSKVNCGFFFGAHLLGGYNFGLGKGLIGFGAQASYLFDVTNKFGLGPYIELGFRTLVPSGSTVSSDPIAKMTTYHFSALGGIYASYKVLEFLDIFGKVGLGAWVGTGGTQFVADMGFGLRFNIPRYVNPDSIPSAK